jgi:hypothetical protein
MKHAPRFYNADNMAQIAVLLDLIKEITRDDPDADLYISRLDITIRHNDDYTIGRIGLDGDTVFFELTDEDYGAEPDTVESVTGTNPATSISFGWEAVLPHPDLDGQ